MTITLCPDSRRRQQRNPLPASGSAGAWPWHAVVLAHPVSPSREMGQASPGPPGSQARKLLRADGSRPVEARSNMDRAGQCHGRLGIAAPQGLGQTENCMAALHGKRRGETDRAMPLAACEATARSSMDYGERGERWWREAHGRIARWRLATRRQAQTVHGAGRSGQQGHIVARRGGGKEGQGRARGAQMTRSRTGWTAWSREMESIKVADTLDRGKCRSLEGQPGCPAGGTTEDVRRRRRFWIAGRSLFLRTMGHGGPFWAPCWAW